jgi:WD40 repeat protein
MWDASTNERCVTLVGHGHCVRDVAFSPDGRLIATASADDTARIWDSVTGEPRGTLVGHGQWVRDVAFSPDGQLIATASDDGTVRIWDPATSELLAVLAPFDYGSAVLLPDGSYRVNGDVGANLWWAVKLRRFGPGELDPYYPDIRSLEPGELLPFMKK